MRHGKITGFMLSVVLLVGLWTAPLALAQDKPRHGGILNVALAADPPSLDMHQEQTFAVAQPLGPIYNNLIQFDPYNYPQIIGDLAKHATGERHRQTRSGEGLAHSGAVDDPHRGACGQDTQLRAPAQPLDESPL